MNVTADAPSRQVFINCPYDPKYRDTFYAVVFAVMSCGFDPRSALEAEGSGNQRFIRILDLVRECSLGIHDLSRVELTKKGLPRFNMPFELGLYVGAKHFGDDHQQKKDFLILEGRRNQCQNSCSDLGGVDPMNHGGYPMKAVEHVRTWLNNHVQKGLPGPKALRRDYKSFNDDLPSIMADWSIQLKEAKFQDFKKAVRQWLSLKEKLAASGVS
jgi:hypothetical protein